MEISSETSVGEIVRANFKTAQIFDKNGIDYCCGGNINLEDACRKSKLDIQLLLPQLEAAVQINDPDSNYIDTLALNELCDYIERRHHAYVNENAPFLLSKLQKLCDVHGANHSELFEIRELFEGAVNNLSMHMKKEELVLFPYIRKMVKTQTATRDSKELLGKAREIIAVMNEEHETEGARFERISQLSSAYSCPPDGCSTYKVSYQSLNDFEDDLHRHIHLENNILFKKALILENELLNK